MTARRVGASLRRKVLTSAYEKAQKSARKAAQKSAQKLDKKSARQRMIEDLLAREKEAKRKIAYLTKGAVPGGTRDAMTPPDFGKSVNPISTKGGKVSPPNNTGTSRFSDLPTPLFTATSQAKQEEKEKIQRKELEIHEWFARNQSLYLKAELKKKKKAKLSDDISDDDLDECDICNNFTICANCI